MKRILTLILAIAMLLALTACDSSGDGTGSKNITIVTSNSGGTWYYIGAAQSQILSNGIEGVLFTAESTDGSPTTNGPIVQGDPNSIGIIVLDSMQQLLEGTYPEMPQTLDKLRLIMAGNATKLQFVTLAETGITSMEDLAGKRIATSNPGTAVRIATLQVLEAIGYSESDFASVTAMTPSEMADALKDGAVDVAVFNGGTPAAGVSDLNSTRDIVMLQVPLDVLDKVVEEHPAYKTYVVTSEVYSDLTEDCVILGLPSGIFCNADMDEDLVYEIAKVLNESTEELAAAHSEGADWNTENSLEVYLDGGIPFHPGAARYYDEVLGR